MLKDDFLNINNDLSNSISVCQKTQELVKNKTGFGYDNREEIIKDLFDEIKELQYELEQNNMERIKEELADVVFVLCNLSNKYDIDLNNALLYSTKEYQRRLTYIENKLGKIPTKEEIINNWKEAKINK